MFLTTLGAILPTFVLIVLGYGFRRSGYLSEFAAKGLPEFAFKVALPALLFKTIASAAIPTVPSYAILGAYFGAALILWAIVTVLTTSLIKQAPAAAPALVMASTFSNVAILGLALGLALIGPDAAPLLALIVSVDAMLLWFAATLHLALVEARPVGAPSLGKDLRDVTWRVLSNPVIAASIAGLLWQRLGLGIQPDLNRIITLIGAAGVPAALFAIGMALAGYSLSSTWGPVALIVVAKLVAFPLLAYTLAIFVFAMPPRAVALVTLLAGMPVGANAYLFAQAYKQSEAAVSASIAITTPLSALTLTALAILLGLVG